MKQLIRTAVPVLGLIFFAACGNTGKNESANDTTAHEGHAHTTATDAPVAGVQLKDDKLNAVYQHYAHLTTALIKGDAADAKVAANAIETGAGAVADGQQLATAAAKITTAADIEAARTAYSTLSNEFIELARKSGLNSGALYVDYCPMAMDNKGGYWLSASKEIKNPYFGEEMMTCGEIKDSIGTGSAE